MTQQFFEDGDIVVATLEGLVVLFQLNLLVLEGVFFSGQLCLQIADNRHHFSGGETAEIGS